MFILAMLGAFGMVGVVMSVAASRRGRGALFTGKGRLGCAVAAIPIIGILALMALMNSPR